MTAGATAVALVIALFMAVSLVDALSCLGRAAPGPGVPLPEEVDGATIGQEI
jgi:hypothetical protein